ncbi:MAG: hypothetical protein II689_04895 [Firmicutes bacterium]|nr:hypothetical protein [Bacillota bacterium]
MKKWLEESNVWYRLYSDLKLTGEQVHKKEIVDILAGTLLEDVPLELYGFIHNYNSVFRDMVSASEMESTLNTKLLEQWHDKISGDGLRNTTRAIYEWSYVPPHFSEIPELLGKLFRTASRLDIDPVGLAVYIYTGLLEICPYRDDTVIMAGIAFSYVLISNGIPVCGFELSEQEYNKMVADLLATHDNSAFRDMVERNIYNRIEVALQYALQAKRE